MKSIVKIKTKNAKIWYPTPKLVISGRRKYSKKPIPDGQSWEEKHKLFNKNLIFIQQIDTQQIDE